MGCKSLAVISKKTFKYWRDDQDRIIRAPGGIQVSRVRPVECEP